MTEFVFVCGRVKLEFCGWDPKTSSVKETERRPSPQLAAWFVSPKEKPLAWTRSRESLQLVRVKFATAGKPLPSLRQSLFADWKSFMDVRLQLGVSSLVVKVSKFLMVAERGSWLRFSKTCLVVAVNKFGMASKRPQSTPVGPDDDFLSSLGGGSRGGTEAQPEGLQDVF